MLTFFPPLIFFFCSFLELQRRCSTIRIQRVFIWRQSLLISGIIAHSSVISRYSNTAATSIIVARTSSSTNANSANTASAAIIIILPVLHVQSLLSLLHLSHRSLERRRDGNRLRIALRRAFDVRSEILRRNVQIEAQIDEHAGLNVVQVSVRDAADGREVAVVERSQVDDLAGDADGDEEELVDVERREEQRRVAAGEAVEDDERRQQRRGRDVRILSDALNVGVDRDAGRRVGLVVGVAVVGRRELPQRLVDRDDVLERGRDDGHQPAELGLVLLLQNLHFGELAPGARQAACFALVGRRLSVDDGLAAAELLVRRQLGRGLALLLCLRGLLLLDSSDATHRVEERFEERALLAGGGRRACVR